MSSEIPAARRKRPSPDANSAPSNEDHRKRRRNRTTQSCLNCHTSKRMCDRKRPACARCTQLGLTGLCVYEVDDPTQRSDSQDESVRLLKRVAELEGVIRELKHKPHPRWVQTTSVELEKWTSRSHLRSLSEGGQGSSSTVPSPSSSLSEKSEVSSPGGRSTRSSSIPNSYPPTISLNTAARRPSQTTASSPQSTPSPGLVTPTDELSQSRISLTSQLELHQDYDLSSMFLSCPSFIAYDPASFGSLSKPDGTVPGDSCYQKASTGNCGCLHEAASYNVLFELSLCLRRAADALACSASHEASQPCHLHQRISELDIMTLNALGSISTSPEDLPNLVVPRSGGSQPPATNSQVELHPSPSFAHPADSLQSIRTWDLLPSVADSPASCEDGFMTWEPSRQL